jgi:hypothetical protein
MSVLTCPFATIAAVKLAEQEVQYPNAVELSTELTIKPTAGESWDVEGLSIQFATAYVVDYSINLNNAKKQLEEVLTSIMNQNEAAKRKAVHLEEQIAQLKKVGAKGAEKEVFEIAAQERAVEAEIQGTVEDQEGYVRDKKATEKELAELGKQSLLEGAKSPPLEITARLYARRNELIWTSSLVPEHQFFTVKGFEWFPATTRTLKGEWHETLDTHTQFDDPISFGERENLRLVIEFAAPPVVAEVEGGFTGLVIGGEIASSIQAIVNYSRHTEAGQ